MTHPEPPPRSDDVEPPLVTRRALVKGATAAAIVAAAGCGDDESVGPSTTSTGSTTENRAPVWSEIPDQTWTVGQPVEFDLADYCTDPDDDPLTFSLDIDLPPGLTLEGSVIRGTPTEAFPSTPAVATADDGQA